MPPESAALLQSLAWWALQFSPRVCLLEQSVLLELEASRRLFGGAAALLARLRAGAADWVQEQQAVTAATAAQPDGSTPPSLPLASAPTALAALAFLKTQTEPFSHCPPSALQARLDALPIEALSAALAHASTLQQLGCRQLGQLRRLPRGGLSRRFGAPLLDALDRAYGLQTERYAWVTLPEQFHLWLEFNGRIEHAAGLMFGAHRLLLQLKNWLAARRSGVTGVLLHWEHDLHSRSGQSTDSHAVHTAQATRDMQHLARLLAEHLARLRLEAPVVAISLQALGVETLNEHSASLLPEDRQSGESLQQFIERLSARLGPERVLRGEPLADHRPQQMLRWQAATEAKATRAPAPRYAPQASHPPWLLRQPLTLAEAAGQPLYQGPLTRLAGPERIEAGWWDHDENHPGLTLRDYYIARSEHAGLLWIYREREPGQDAASAAAGRWCIEGIYG